MATSDRQLLRWSLVGVWLITALVSIAEWNGQSMALLSSLETPHAWVRPGLIGAGIGVDLVLAIWLAFGPGRHAYLIALTTMLLMTLLATSIQPDWWLHPLGPLTKNVPIAAILIVLLRQPEESP